MDLMMDGNKVYSFRFVSAGVEDFHEFPGVLQHLLAE
jgi:hypothetical protein